MAKNTAPFTSKTAQLMQSLETQIKGGMYQQGEKLPSIRALTSFYSLSKHTVVEALDRLMAKGLIDSRPGSGFFVTTSLGETTSSGSTEPQLDTIDAVWLMREQLRTVPDILSVGDGFPDTAWFSELDISKFFNKAFKTQSHTMLRYGDRLGFLPLRKLLVNHLQTLAINSQPEQLLLTHGANEALDLVIRAFITPQSTVLVDDPSYYPLLRKLALSHCRIIGIPRQADGPDTQALERALAQHRPSLFFTQSVAHNPTGTDISPEKIARIQALTLTHNCLVVENDALSDLVGTQAPRLASGPGYQQSLYISTFSKTITPALRVGYIAGDDGLINQLADLKALININSSEYAERLIYSVLSSRQYDHHLKHYRQHLAAACQHAQAIFKNLGADLFCASNHSLYHWVRFAQVDDSIALAKTLLPHKIVLAPGQIFSPNGAHQSAWARYNVATINQTFAERIRPILNPSSPKELPYSHP